MMNVITYIQSRLASQKGQGIVEYALILAFVVIVAAAITSGDSLQTKVKGAFDNITAAFK